MPFVDAAIASSLAILGIAMTRLPGWLIATTLAAANGLLVMLDLVQIPMFACILPRVTKEEHEDPSRRFSPGGGQ